MKKILLFISIVTIFSGCSYLQISRTDLEDAYRQGVRDGLTQNKKHIRRAEIPDPLKGGAFVGDIKK